METGRSNPLLPDDPDGKVATCANNVLISVTQTVNYRLFP